MLVFCYIRNQHKVTQVSLYYFQYKKNHLYLYSKIDLIYIAESVYIFTFIYVSVSYLCLLVISTLLSNHCSKNLTKYIHEIRYEQSSKRSWRINTMTPNYIKSSINSKIDDILSVSKKICIISKMPKIYTIQILCFRHIIDLICIDIVSNMWHDFGISDDSKHCKSLYTTSRYSTIFSSSQEINNLKS